MKFRLSQSQAPIWGRHPMLSVLLASSPASGSGPGNLRNISRGVGFTHVLRSGSFWPPEGAWKLGLQESAPLPCSPSFWLWDQPWLVLAQVLGLG